MMAIRVWPSYHVHRVPSQRNLWDIDDNNLGWEFDGDKDKTIQRVAGRLDLMVRHNLGNTFVLSRKPHIKEYKIEVYGPNEEVKFDSNWIHIGTYYDADRAVDAMRSYLDFDAT